jgi:Tol biopolymer transport system component
MLNLPRLIAATLLLAFANTNASAAEDPQADRFISRTRQLTFEGRSAGEGYFSPDGTKLIFQSEREADNPFYQIYILDLSTGDTHRVSPGIGKTTCGFFRPGTDDVLFASTHLDPDARNKQEERIADRSAGKEPRYAWDYDAHMDIFSSKQDGAQLKRLTDAPGYDAEGAYSPDGAKIVFCSLRDRSAADKMTDEEKHYAELDPAYFGEIYIMDADGGNQTRLTDWPGYDGGPFFTPDGERIVWRHFQPGTMIADVYTMKLDGSDRRRLTDFGSMSWAPYFHPSGAYCIFNSNKLGMKNWELFVVDALGEKEPVRVTHTDGVDLLGVFSPDGKKLAWTSTRHGADGRKGQLYLADWDHEAALKAVREAPPRQGADDTADKKHDSDLETFATKQRESQRDDAEHDVEREKLTVTELARFAERQREIQRRLSSEITEQDLRIHVAFLADDRLAGRMTGTRETRAAAEYIAEQFAAAGLKPLGDNGTYFQSFPFNAGIQVAESGNALAVSKAEDRKSFALDKDFRPLGLSQDGEFSGEVVFAGYGIVAEGHDSYGETDVTDKCVVVLRYFPENVAVERKTELARNASLRVKAMHARRLGAKALLVVSGPNSPHAGELIKLSADGAGGNSGILAASISLDVLSDLLGRSEERREIAAIQEALDAENPHGETTFALQGINLNLSVNLLHEKRQCQNVVGVLPAQQEQTRPQYVVVGAHYDHLGHGEGGDAFGYEEGKTQIYNGADDNASGAAALVEIATALAAEPGIPGKPRNHGVIFAAWSGEEIGLIGSDHFVEGPPVPTERMAAYVNMDMVGRMEDNKLIVQGAGSSPGWRGLVEKRNVPLGFDLTVQDDPYLPTDTSSFYRVHVPVLHVFTGSHQDYHRPSDTADKLNYPDLARVAKFTHALVGDLAHRDERLAYVRVERTSSGRSGGMGMRAYTGTEPDYAYTGGDGMKLKGVIPGGPAEKAGVQPGDLIVELGGLNITNVYEYSHALSVLKPDKTVKIIVTRNGERKELTITPTARD